MRKLNLLTAFLAIFLLLNACDIPFGTEKKIDAITSNLDFETVLQQSRLAYSDADYNIVIKNNDELNQFISKYMPHISASPFAPITSKVNFDIEMLVIVGCGMHSSGSDYIEVNSIKSNGTKITVYAKEVIATIGTTDIGYPIHIVKLLKSDLPIEFAKREIVKQKPVENNFAIPFKTLLQGSHEVISEKPFDFVLRSQEEVDKFVNSYKSNSYDGNGKPIGIKLPNIDFNKEIILVLHLGTQSSGSNKLSIEKVAMMDGVIYVYSVLSIPAIGTDDIGYPVHIVSIPKYDSKVVFQPTQIVKLSGNTDDDNDNYPKNDLMNSKWELYSWTNIAGETLKFQDIQFFQEEPYFTPENFFIDFISNKNLVGKAGCNEFKAIYKADSGYMGIADLDATKMNCFMTSDFLTAVGAAYKYELINKSTLHIISADKNMNVMEFTLVK